MTLVLRKHWLTEENATYTSNSQCNKEQQQSLSCTTYSNLNARQTLQNNTKPVCSIPFSVKCICTCVCVCVWLGPTIGGDPDDGEEDLVLRCVLVEDADGRVGDDHSGVFLHVDAADRHHRPLVLHTLLDTHSKMKRVMAACWQAAGLEDGKWIKTAAWQGSLAAQVS